MPEVLSCKNNDCPYNWGKICMRKRALELDQYGQCEIDLTVPFIDQIFRFTREEQKENLNKLNLPERN